MRIHVIVLAIAAAMVLSALQSCASLQRRSQEAIDRASIPNYKESAITELAITKSRIATAETWLTNGEAVKDSLHLSEKKYAQLKDEAEANLAFLKSRQSLLEAAIPTLPAKPAPVPPNSAAPVPAQ